MTNTATCVDCQADVWALSIAGAWYGGADCGPARNLAAMIERRAEPLFESRKLVERLGLDRAGALEELRRILTAALGRGLDADSPERYAAKEWLRRLFAAQSG